MRQISNIIKNMKFTKIKCFLVGLCSAVFFLKYPDVVAGDHEKNFTAIP